MDDGGRRCALPGCGVEIQTVSGRPERRYCSAGHRATARQVRRAVHARQRAAGADGDLAGALPWVHGATVPARRDARSTGPVLRPAARYTAEAVESRVEPGVVARAAAGRSRDTHHDARPRRRRALAVIGVAGLLAGGYAATARTEPPVPAQAAPDGLHGDGSVDGWAQRATEALAAANTQLDTLARAEDRWEQLPASRTGVVPAPVAALVERRAVLERRRASLQSQLDGYRSLREMQQDLADSEQHLWAVEKALADAAAGDGPALAALPALEEQRDLRIRQHDAGRAELERLEDGVATAVRTPLPDDGAVTDEVSRGVLELVRDGGTAARPTAAEASESSGACGASGADVVAQLHEQARRVAREARRAEAERRATPSSAGAAAPGRHRAPERLQVTRIAIRAVPGGRALDDDAIEERNADSTARSGSADT